jgi:hypothetical protein
MTGKCLDRGNNMEQSDVTVNKCSESASQIWKFDYYNEGTDNDIQLESLPL